MQSGREQLLKAEKGGRARNALFRAVREGSISAKVLLKGGSLLQALACKRIPENSGLHLRFPLSFFTQRHTVPSLAWDPFLHTIRPEPAVKGQDRRIGFFVGCGANYLFPNVAGALVRILRRMGVHPVIPRDQVCCGLPAYASGDTETARKLAQKNIEVFETLELDAILTVCASCGSHVKTLTSLFSDDGSLRDAVASMAKKHMDAMTFLADHLGFETYLKDVQSSRTPKDTRPLRVAYHDPCHLRLGQGMTDAPRRILDALPGVQLAETPHPGQCCGHGGEFNLSHFSLSMKILDRRMEDFRKAKPETIVTGCTGCLLQFAEGISRIGLARKIEVCHPLVLAEKYFKDALD
jgi:glycolate oxidase iron-sulfur subunit